MFKQVSNLALNCVLVGALHTIPSQILCLHVHHHPKANIYAYSYIKLPYLSRSHFQTNDVMAMCPQLTLSSFKFTFHVLCDCP